MKRKLGPPLPPLPPRKHQEALPYLKRLAPGVIVFPRLVVRRTSAIRRLPRRSFSSFKLPLRVACLAFCRDAHPFRFRLPSVISTTIFSWQERFSLQRHQYSRLGCPCQSAT